MGICCSKTNVVFPLIEDIKIQLANDVEYNVTDLLKRYDNETNGYKLNAHKNIRELYSRYEIRDTPTVYNKLYEDITIIIKTMCQWFGEQHEMFADTECVLTGSVLSRVKLGKLDEIDFIMKLNKKEQTSVFQEVFYRLTTHLRDNHAEKEKLTNGFTNWSIKEFRNIIKICGVCIILRHENDDGKDELITVDLVPAYQVIISPEMYIELLTNEAQLFLKLFGGYDEFKEDFYSLLTGHEPIDTGLIENKILRALPNILTQRFRMAKCMLYEFEREADNEVKSRSRNNSPKPTLKSYWLRIIFLHFLVKTFPSKLCETWDDTACFLCLMEMMTNLIKQITKSGKISYTHPLLKSQHLHIENNNTSAISFKKIMDTISLTTNSEKSKAGFFLIQAPTRKTKREQHTGVTSIDRSTPRNTSPPSQYSFFARFKRTNTPSERSFSARPFSEFTELFVDLTPNSTRGPWS